MKLKEMKYIFKPSFWIMNNPYDEEWDKRINELIDKKYKVHYPENGLRYYYVKIDDELIWIANYPYGFCVKLLNVDPIRLDMNRRPSRSTIERLHNYIKNNS